MSLPTLENKTIRPGSLGAYSYYHSNRRPPATNSPRPGLLSLSRSKIPYRRPLLISLAVILLVGLPMLVSYNHSVHNRSGAAISANTPQDSPAGGVLAASTNQAVTSDGRCVGTTAKVILVSVSQRRLWACAGGKTARQSPVITGMLAQESTQTPTGTYRIYGKMTNTTLKGNDATGSWSDPVYYWMPFLDNQHGTYGFHDATWRPDNSFGKVDPHSSQASHGCVELPLGVSKWLYNWAPVGTTVTVEQ